MIIENELLTENQIKLDKSNQSMLFWIRNLCFSITGITKNHFQKRKIRKKKNPVIAVTNNSMFKFAFNEFSILSLVMHAIELIKIMSNL